MSLKLASVATYWLSMQLECTIWDYRREACNAGIDTCALWDEAIWDYATNNSTNDYLNRTSNAPKSAKSEKCFTFKYGEWNFETRPSFLAFYWVFFL